MNYQIFNFAPLNYIQKNLQAVWVREMLIVKLPITIWSVHLMEETQMKEKAYEN